MWKEKANKSEFWDFGRSNAHPCCRRSLRQGGWTGRRSLMRNTNLQRQGWIYPMAPSIWYDVDFELAIGDWRSGRQHQSDQAQDYFLERYTYDTMPSVAFEQATSGRADDYYFLARGYQILSTVDLNHDLPVVPIKNAVHWSTWFSQTAQFGGGTPTLQNEAATKRVIWVDVRRLWTSRPAYFGAGQRSDHCQGRKPCSFSYLSQC